jgi:hypothetical protein
VELWIGILKFTARGKAVQVFKPCFRFRSPPSRTFRLTGTWLLFPCESAEVRVTVSFNSSFTREKLSASILHSREKNCYSYYEICSAPNQIIRARKIGRNLQCPHASQEQETSLKKQKE